jgi:prophage antirepressor-like protein
MVRTAVIDGAIYFGLADVLHVMKSSTTTTQAQAAILDGMGKGYVRSIPLATSGGEQNLLFVSEGALKTTQDFAS